MDDTFCIDPEDLRRKIIPSLVEKRSNSRDGFPWMHPANAFAAE